MTGHVFFTEELDKARAAVHSLEQKLKKKSTSVHAGSELKDIKALHAKLDEVSDGNPTSESGPSTGAANPVVPNDGINESPAEGEVNPGLAAPNPALDPATPTAPGTTATSNPPA